MLQHYDIRHFHKKLRQFGRWLTAILLMLFLLGVSGAQAKSQAFSEDQVKAVYLFNLTSFVSWPSIAFDAPDTPLRSAVLGDGDAASFIEIFRKVIKGESFGRRAIVIDRLLSSADPSGYHILFIPTSQGPAESRLLNSIKGRSILTVGDSSGFCQRGGVVNLLRRGNRINLEINIDAAKAANLKISSKLLRIATIVQTSGQNGGDQ